MAHPLTYHQLSLSIRFNTVLFPFDAAQFFRALEKNGFVLDDKIASTPFGARIEVSGFVARKVDTSIRIDTNRQVLAVHCPDPNIAVEQMTLLESILMKEFGLDASTLAEFYEIIVNVTQDASVNPIAGWSKRYENDPLTHMVSRLIGKPVFPFGAKFATQSVVPNHTDWFEIEVSPFVIAPTEKHNIEIVYRNANREDVFGFMRRLENILHELVELVEK